MKVKRFTHKKYKNGPEWCSGAVAKVASRDTGEFEGESIIMCGVHD